MTMGRKQKRSSLPTTTESSSHSRSLFSTCLGSSKAGRRTQQRSLDTMGEQNEESGDEEGQTSPMQKMRGFCAPLQGLSRRCVLLCLLTGVAICAIMAVIVSSGLGSPAVIIHRPKKQLARMDSSTVTSKMTIHEEPSEYIDARHSTSAISTSASFTGKKEGTTGTNQMLKVSEHEEDIKVLAASTTKKEQRPPYLLYSDPTTRTSSKKERTDMILMPPKESAEEVARMLQQEGEKNNCVLSQETSFVYRILVKLNSLNGTCMGSTGATTNGTLSENDKEQMTNVIVSSFSTLAENYCDPYVRNVTSADIVREQEHAPSSAQPPSVTLEVQVLGTLRCRASELGCNVTKIGLFHSPGQVVDPQEQQEPTCSCPLVNNTGLIATDRGPSEAEFMEHFGVRLATVAPSLDCPGLQAAECTFGTVFQSALAVTFADEDAARNATDLIGPEALRTLNELYSPDDPTICYPEFRVFDSVSVVFQEARRLLQNMVTPSASPGANVSSPTSLVNGTEPSPIVNVTSAPSTSPSSIDGALSSPQPFTAILYVGGVCSQCGGQLFFQNDVSTRRRLGAASFQDAMEDRPGGRKLQTINTIKSNCFCPIDSVVAEVPGPGIDEFVSTLAERLQLEITDTQQVDPESFVVVNDDETFVNNGIYSFPCTNISSTFKKNVTLEVQVTCGSAPELSDEDKNNIGFVYANAYNSLRTTVCDPFNLEVTSAKVVETGDLRADGSSSSLPLRIEVTMICYGCDPLATDVYGFPEVFLEEEVTADINNETRYLRRGLQKVAEGTCSCNSTLPRRSPLEADVTAAFDLISVKQQDLLLPACIGNASTCDFGKTFTASALLEVQGTLDPLETASILEQAFTNALDRLIGGGNATQCNPLFGLVSDTQVYLDFVYNSVDRNANDTTARRRLQQDLLPTVAPTSDSTFTFSWMAYGSNITDTPTTAPTVQTAGESAFFLLDAYGVCNGCATELIFNNDAADGRRRLEQNKHEDAISITPPLIELRFLEDIAGEEPESECYCPIGSVEVVTNFDEISLLEIIQEEVAKISSNLTVIETVSGITRVDCVEQTPFSTTINFHFSAFEWVVNNPDDVQGLGDVIARIYNGLVEEFCDEYFRSSISLTFVAGSLQRSTTTGRRYDRDLQSMQGCLNYRATFAVTGLCRGCQALGTPIPLFGDSTTNRKLEELVARQLTTQVARPRRLQDTGLTCICDSTSISQRSAPSRAAVRAGLEALIPDSLPWALNPSICGPTVDVEIPCPTIPAGPSTTISLQFYARRSNGGCLNAADLQLMATQFLNTFNTNMQLGHFPCEPQYLQVSNIIIDPSTLGGCRRDLLRGSNKIEESESQGDVTARKLLQDFSPISASMTVTGNIYATNIDAILASEGSDLRAAAASIEQTSGGTYEIITGRATNSPSGVPSAFPSSFPSAFPSEFPSGEPSKSPSAEPTGKPSHSPSDSPTTEDPLCPTTGESCTGTDQKVIAWCGSSCCDSYGGSPACVWTGQTTVTIFKGSCNGDNACYFGTATITVAANSCNGPNACAGVGAYANSVNIAAGSCIGETACVYIGFYATTGVTIGSGSCKGDYSCLNVGDTKATFVEIGDGSCTDPYSCFYLGDSQATSVTITGSACTAAVCTYPEERICGAAPDGFTSIRYQDIAGAVTCGGCGCLSSR